MVDGRGNVMLLGRKSAFGWRGLMKNAFYPILFAVGAMQGAPAFAGASSASPLLGSWAVDTRN
jgi:hypothetical protein